MVQKRRLSRTSRTIWDSYVKFLKYLIALPKSRQPQGKSFTILEGSFNDPLMKAKLKYLELVSNKLNKFLRAYQMNQPMVLEVSKKQFGKVMEKLVATGCLKLKEADEAKD